MRHSEILERIRVIKDEMQRCRDAVVRFFYTDKDEVALWKAVYDELLLERNLLERELETVRKPLTEEQEALALEWAIRFASHPDREG